MVTIRFECLGDVSRDVVYGIVYLPAQPALLGDRRVSRQLPDFLAELRREFEDNNACTTRASHAWGSSSARAPPGSTT
jgi:hypothetical protein